MRYRLADAIHALMGKIPGLLPSLKWLIRRFKRS